MRTDPLTRLMARTVVDADGCRLWMGTTNEHGYGRFKVNGQRAYVHRWIYAQYRGVLAPEQTVDHLCHNADQTCAGGDTCKHRRCVERTHLVVATRAENVLRGRRPLTAEEIGRRTRSLRGARRPTCKRGHPFDLANTYWTAAGRHCRACRKAAVYALRAKRRIDTD